MKKLIAFLVVLGLCVAPVTAFADYYEQESDDHSHDVRHPERRNPLGVGADVILHEGSEGELLNKVHGEYRWDWQNDEHSVFAIVTTKLEDVWGAIKGLVNRGGE